MKHFILKSVVWNDNGYKGPSSCQSTSGYTKDFGYGHEEWNNHPDWIWQGFRVFHAQSKADLSESAKDGNLGILMLASIDGKQHAIGLATSVTPNTEDQMMLQASELNFYDNWEQVWALDSVKSKKAFKGKKQNFMKIWDENYHWNQWKCPEVEYIWFDKPILLNPEKITGKQKLTAMHSGYQTIEPKKLLPYIRKRVPANHPCMHWLTEGEFYLGTPKRSSGKKSSRGNKSGSAASTAYGYHVEGGYRCTEPRHATLQSQYILYLRKNNLKYEEDQNCVDVVYQDGKKEVYVEVKPTYEAVKSKYAIRSAVGQLLEYQFYNNDKAKLEIVIGNKPDKKSEIEFVKSLGIQLTYFNGKTFIKCK
jgi:hypothetical protein